MSGSEQQSVDVECKHNRVSYTNPLVCMDCGATLGENDGTFKIVTIDKLSPEKQAAIRAAASKDTIFPTSTNVDPSKLAHLARPNKKGRGSWPPRGVEQITNLNQAIKAEGISESIEIDLEADLPAPQKADPPKKPVKGAITKIEALSAKERIFVVNGVKFFAAVTDAGFRVLSACHESKKTLESAARVLEMKGWLPKVKRSKDDKSLFVLEAKEKRPSGPWPEEDAKPEAKT